MFFKQRSYESIKNSKLREHQKNYFDRLWVNSWLKGDIPFDFTNNSYYAESLAANFFDIIKNTNKKNKEKIKILEVGSGSWLFGLNFLKSFEEISYNSNTNYYNNLEYHFSDYSETIINDLKRNSHIKKYLSKDKARVQKFDITTDYLETNYDLVILNYVVCNIPFDYILREKEVFYQKLVNFDPGSYLMKYEFQETNDFSYKNTITNYFDQKGYNKTSLPVAFFKFIENIFKENKNLWVYIWDSELDSAWEFDIKSYGGDFFGGVDFELLEFWSNSNNLNTIQKKFDAWNFVKSFVTNSFDTAVLNQIHKALEAQKDDYLYNKMKKYYNLVKSWYYEEAEEIIADVLNYRKNDANIYYHYSKVLQKQKKPYKRVLDKAKQLDYLGIYNL